MIDLTRGHVYPIRVIAARFANVYDVEKTEQHKNMTQRSDGSGLYWADEESVTERSQADKIILSGEHFWRSVWKRIEGSSEQRPLEARKSDLALEPPRDYVIDTDNRHSAL